MTTQTWADTLTLPGETPDAAMKRRINMHELVMTRGISLGVIAGVLEYSDPIDHRDPAYAVCPWHGEPCSAWTEIREGRGNFTAKIVELEAAQVEFDAAGGRGVELAELIDSLTEQIENRPSLNREWTPPEKDPNHNPLAPSKGYVAAEQHKFAAPQHVYSKATKAPAAPAPEDARDTAYEALSVDTDAVIDVEGDEE